MAELVAILSTLLMASGQIILKLGLNRMGKLTEKPFWESVVLIITNPNVIIGAILYVIAAFVWVWVLQQRPLSYIYPFLATTYIFALVGSSLVLGEPINWVRWAGVAVIGFGIFLISRTI
ncbi:MAG: EamA family transporter [Caldisericia bacterium]|nr:EamA family transporter [Caldisericia bacterium]